MRAGTTNEEQTQGGGEGKEGSFLPPLLPRARKSFLLQHRLGPSFHSRNGMNELSKKTPLFHVHLI